MIESGHRRVEDRRTLERLAQALRVSPSALTGTPWVHEPDGEETHACIVEMEAALDRTDLGEDPEVPVREWPAIVADVDRLVGLIHLYSDYAAQGELAPDLLVELHGAYRRLPERRKEVLLGLIHCYSSICWVGKRLGRSSLPLMAAKLAQKCADELDDLAWRGYTAWLRGQATGQISRPYQLMRAVSMIDELSPGLDSSPVLETAGMLHLSAALASAAQADRNSAETHLAEASALAGRMDADVGSFGAMWFGRVNVGIWQTALTAEHGDLGRAAEIGRRVAVQVDAVPSPSRRAEHYMELGRIELAGDRSTWRPGLAGLLAAETLATQRVHTDPFVRELVLSRLRVVRDNDAIARDLRGLAYRMRIAA